MSGLLGFSFNGKTIWRPGVLVSTAFGGSVASQLLPFGTICLFGTSDGGNGDGAYYIADDIAQLKRVLRGGPLLNAFKRVSRITAASRFVAVVIGHKTVATLVVAGGGGASATFTSGDQGLWNNGIKIAVAVGTTSGFKVTFQWPNADGSITTYGGAGTPFDNLATFADLKTAIEADQTLTPNPATGFPPILTINITTAGALAVFAQAPMTGGLGDGTLGPVFADWKKGIDNVVDVPFDLAHMVGCYDQASQAYASGQAQQLEPLGRLRNWRHQANVTGTAGSSTKVVNSAALLASGLTLSQALNYYRNGVCAQKVLMQDPDTGQNVWTDLAIPFVALEALKGATGSWGPATPLAYETLPGVVDLDYPILDSTGDMDQAVKNGIIAVERIGASGQTGSVRIVSGVTAEPTDPNGNGWQFKECSVVRVSDAVLLNVKAAIEGSAPKGLGAGNTRVTRTALIAEVVDVLEQAMDDQWITGYDKASIDIVPANQSGNDAIIHYAMSPTLPFNHAGIAQKLIPFQVAAASGGAVNG